MSSGVSGASRPRTATRMSSAAWTAAVNGPKAKIPEAPLSVCTPRKTAFSTSALSGAFSSATRPCEVSSMRSRASARNWERSGFTAPPAR